MLQDFYRTKTSLYFHLAFLCYPSLLGLADEPLLAAKFEGRPLGPAAQHQGLQGKRFQANIRGRQRSHQIRRKGGNNPWSPQLKNNNPKFLIFTQVLKKHLLTSECSTTFQLILFLTCTENKDPKGQC